MPGFVNDAGDVFFAFGVAQDKSIFIGVFRQPFGLRRIGLLFVQRLIIGTYQIHGQAGMMFAGSHQCQIQFGLPVSFRVVMSHLHQFFHGFRHQPGLVLIIPVSGTDDDVQTFFLRVIQHQLQGSSDFFMYQFFVSCLNQFGLKRFSQRVLIVYQNISPVCQIHRKRNRQHVRIGYSTLTRCVRYKL